MSAGRHASRTAVLVCQGRAAAHERLAPHRFADPTAAELLRPAERAAVEQVRAGEPPKDWRSRIDVELIRACAEVMVPRTIAIDDAIGARPTPQVVLLGAGLDGRCWRLPALSDVEVFEVDHPASQADKKDRVGGKPPLARLSYVPVDLARDPLAPALGAAGHDPNRPTTWVWEGVVPYLTRAQVRTTVRALAGSSAPGSRLIVNFQAPGVTAGLGRLFMRAVTTAAGRVNPLAGEPHRSTWTPASMGGLLADRGFTADGDRDLLDLAEQIDMPIHQPRSLRNGHVLIADRL